MELHIGIQNIARELTYDVDMSPEEVENALAAAVADGGIFRVEDSKGRRAFVPVSTLAYVSLGEDEPRRVGFGHA
ncbi:DUF3107 domain-containing protein [Flaviflexus salsibiostraticola]|uniref:DUF3107 domain-containing protein n=1 Tax=Flaviflexus salsibiostraticola TaxID=1282737 RepID=A0A3S8Z865_9ACTO|nr:DUF3107 domain-containing protein [Flaviflexus salsibiostraticola]AZN29643.1 DUF3107 domain-containing protein [Flaviflexus salsibiostraticola]